MKKVTKEWLWLMCAMIGSMLCVVMLISRGIEPRQWLPMGIYIILFPVVAVYLIRVILWAVTKLIRKLRK